MTKNPNEIPTDKIEKIVESALSDRSERNDRIHLLERVVENHSKQLKEIDGRLNDGRVEFVEIRNSIDALAKEFNQLASTAKTATAWILGMIATGLLTTVGSAILWVLQHSGKGTP